MEDQDLQILRYSWWFVYVRSFRNSSLITFVEVQADVEYDHYTDDESERLEVHGVDILPL